MSDYRRGAHTVFEIHLHAVFTTKYRRPVLSGEVGTRVRDLIRDLCAQHEVKIMKGHVAKEHVHLFLSIPPQVTISRLLQWLKGKTAHHLLAEFTHLKKQFWGRRLAAATSDMVATVQEHENRFTASLCGLYVFPVPVTTNALRISQAWHPRFDADPVHRFVRECVLRICKIKGQSRANK